MATATSSPDTPLAPVVEAAAPPEPLTPRERRLLRAAAVLRWGAIVNGGAAILGVLLALAQALGASVLPALHTALLFRFTGADDVALATVLLLLLVNVALLLVLMVGLLARELWAFVGVWLGAAANIAALVAYGYTPALLAVVPLAVAGGMVLRDVRSFWLNPVMIKELRGRMRGMRAFVVLTVYLGLMAGFMLVLYLSFTGFNAQLNSSAAGLAGRLLFVGVVGIELLLIAFIAPAFTSGAVTGERERQTYDLLRTTLLGSPAFVMGKLESALSYILLLLLSAIPLQSVAFLFGGVSQAELLLSFVILAVTAVTLGTAGLYFSAGAQRTLNASVRTYSFVGIVMLGVPFALGLVVRALDFLAGNRSAVFEAALVYINQVLISLNPVGTALQTQASLANGDALTFNTVVLTSGSGGTIPVVSPWISFTLIYLVASAVMLTLTVRRVQRAEGQ